MSSGDYVDENDSKHHADWNDGEYRTYSYEEVHKALKKVRKQHKKGKSLVWTGPDVIHYSIGASTPPPSWYFSPEGLEYEAERGRSFKDVYYQVAWMLAMHNGVVKESHFSEAWKKDAEFWKNEALKDAPTRNRN